MALKDLQVNIGADTSGFNRGVKDVQKGVKDVKSGVGGMGKSLASLRIKAVAVAASITAMAVATVKLMKAYAGLRNSVQRTNELFRESNKYIEYFANNTARAFGMSETTAYQYAMTYGNLFKGITKSTEENAKVTIAMMKASAVIASKTGRTMEDVNERIRSGILGNTEAIEDLGINVPIAMIKTTKAFKQIADGRSWESLTYQEQQQIRVLAILQQSTSQYGDSVSQISGMSLPRLGQAFKDLMSYAGMFVTKALQPIINALGMIVHAATAALKSLSNMLGWDLAGGVKPAAEAIQNGAVGFGDMSDDAKSTSKAVKEIRKNLMGFDELNVLAPPDTGSGDTTGLGGVGSSTAFDGLAMPEFKEMSMPEIDTSNIEKLVGAFAPVKASLEGLKTALEPLKNFAAQGLQDFYEKFLRPVGAWAMGEGIPRFIDSISNGISNINWENINKSLSDLWDALSPFAINIGEGLLWFWDEVITPLGEWVMNDVVPAFLDLLTAAIETANSAIDVLKPLGKWLWDKFLKPLGKWTEGLVVSIIEDVTKALTGVSDWISDHKTEVETLAILVGSFAAAWGLVNIAMGVWSVIGAIATTVTTAFGAAVAFLTSPIGLVVLAIAAIIAIIVICIKYWDEIKAAAVSVWESIKEAWNTMVEWFSDLFEAAWTAIKMAWKAVVEFFQGIWDGIVGVFSGIGDWFKDIFQKAWDGIKAIWDKVVAYYTGIWDGIKLVFSVIGTWFKQKFTDAWNGIKAVFSGVGTFFSGIWDTIKSKFSSIGTSIGDTVGEAFKTVVNAILTFAEDKINGFIGAINTAIGVINNIPGVNINTLSMLDIPKLARGGLATAPTLAVVGDNKNARIDPEVIAPLSKLEDMIGNKIMQAMQFKMQPAGAGGYGGDITVQCILDDREIGRAVVKYQDRQMIKGGR